MFNVKAYYKKYYQDNKEHYKEHQKEYSKKNREHYREYYKIYRQENKEDIRKYYKMWNKTEKGKANNQRGYSKRKARLKNIINTLTAQEWIDILKKYKFRCAYCGKEFTLFDRETRDHIVPISKGGHNVKENIVPACKSCNSKKYNKERSETNVNN